MKNEIVQLDDDFDLSSIGEPNEQVIKHKGGIKPLPRRDHQALLITNN